MCSKNLLDVLKRGIKTNWWVKCPPVDGNSHFENLQSTNWNTLRFKNPPTEDSKIGWRVEFRPMDIQITDYENSVLTVAVGMVANIINEFDLDFVIPISLVDENMKRAHLQDAVTSTKFWFKTDALPKFGSFANSDLQESDFKQSNKNYSREEKLGKPSVGAANDEKHLYKELFIWQILEGDKNAGLPVGLIQLCEEYMAKK